MSRKMTVILVVFILAVQVVAAQVLDCPAIVQTALSQLGDSCSMLDTNTACYGYFRVDSTFNVAVEPDFFSAPSDQASLVDLNTVQTYPMDTANGLWGLAVLTAQSQVEGILPGEAVTFLLMGDTQVENSASSVYERLTFTVSENTVVRGLPAWNANSIGTLDAGGQIQGDTVDPTAQWLRVLHTAGIGWIPADALVESDVIATLPTAPAQAELPMRAFYFSTGIGQPQCGEAPDVLVVRSPESITVNLRINGLDVRMGSIVALRSIAEDEIMMIVLQGHLELIDAGITVNAGQSLTAFVDSSGTVLSLGILRDSTPQEHEIGQTAVQALAHVVPGVQLETPPEESAGSTETGEVTHIVAAGDTLNSIGRQYDASVPAIVERNNLVNADRIFTGQSLVIPNPGSGYVGLRTARVPAAPLAVITPQTPAGAVALDCDGFRATSPLDGLNFGRNTFYWDAAPAAQGYIVTVTNLETNRSVSFGAFGDETSVVGIVDDNIGFGFLVQWSVSALMNGQIACTSGPFVMQRSAPGGAGLLASWSCPSGTSATVSYSGVPSGETVSFSYDVAAPGGTQTVRQTDGPFNGPSGTVTLGVSRGPSTVLSNGVATTSGGLTATITPATCP